MSKPEPQQLNVSGIEATPITMNEPQPESYAALLYKLSNHPPFQMFIHERHKQQGIEDSQSFAFEMATKDAQTQGAEKLVEDYKHWHSQKGYWPNENPIA